MLVLKNFELLYLILKLDDFLSTERELFTRLAELNLRRVAQLNHRGKLNIVRRQQIFEAEALPLHLAQLFTQLGDHLGVRVPVDFRLVLNFPRA